jgi:hypothetical protein
MAKKLTKSNVRECLFAYDVCLLALAEDADRGENAVRSTD